MSAAPPSRRLGAPDSKTRAQLVDAAERLLLAEGYAAVTSRRVAAEADLKPQLVHYYFRTMDDLFLEVFRRRADENLDRLHRAIAEDGSLRRLWQLNTDVQGAVPLAMDQAAPELRQASIDGFRAGMVVAAALAFAGAAVGAFGISNREARGEAVSEPEQAPAPARS